MSNTFYSTEENKKQFWLVGCPSADRLGIGARAAFICKVDCSSSISQRRFSVPSFLKETGRGFSLLGRLRAQSRIFSWQPFSLQEADAVTLFFL
jgi:hypothetical protein